MNFIEVKPGHDIFETETIEQPDYGKDCKGLFYRASKEIYEDSNGVFTYTERLRPLKRLSCPGCYQCDSLKQEFKEIIYPELDGFISNFKKGGLYQLKVTNYYKDYFGEVDYDIEFVLVEENVK